jgi:tetratricopeptide (TPR) repeat protein
MRAARKLWAAVLAFAALSVGFVVRNGGLFPGLAPEAESIRSEIIADLGSLRAFEGRLVGFDYVLPTHAHPGADFSARVRRLQRLADLQPVPDALALRALIDLVSGKSKEAIARLERAVELRPANAWLLSDLSAAYLSWARDSGEPYNLFLALCAADRAWRADPQLAEAQFNRAAALSRLYIQGQAETAWNQYLEIDANSRWAQEARSMLAVLRQPSFAKVWSQAQDTLVRAALANDLVRARKIVAAFPEPAREFAEGEFLGKWAAARRAGQIKASEGTLAALRVIATAVGDVTQDLMLADAVSAIDRALKAKNGSRLSKLIEGHFLYSQGILEDLRVDPTNAKQSFDRAQAQLSLAVSPFQTWAKFESALCNYHALHHDAALASLAALEAERLSRYPILKGRIAWIQGLIYAEQGRFDLSLASYGQAKAEFERSGQASFAGVVDRLLAEALTLLGEEKRAWGYLYSALQAGGKTLDVIRRLSIFERAAVAARQAGQPRAALYFQAEGLTGVSFARNGSLVAGSVALRGEIRSDADDFRGGLEDLKLARALAGELKDEDVRLTLEADISRIEGQILRPLDPEKAISLLTYALNEYQSANYRFLLPRTYLERALAYIRLDRLAGDRRDRQNLQSSGYWP